MPWAHMGCCPLVWEVPTSREPCGRWPAREHAISTQKRVIEGLEGRRRDNGDGRAAYPIRRADGKGTNRGR